MQDHKGLDDLPFCSFVMIVSKRNANYDLHLGKRWSAVKQIKLPKDIHIPKNLIIAFLTIIGTISTIFGCATVKEPPYEEPRYVSLLDVIHLEPTKTFDLPALLTADNCPSVDVQLTKPGEVAKESPENPVKGAFYGFAGGFLLTVGICGRAGPEAADLCLTAATAVGAIFGTLGAVAGTLIYFDQSNITKAFQETNFSDQIQYLLEKNLSSYFMGQPDGITEIKLLILDYGFTTTSTTGDNNLIFHCDTDIQVWHAGELVFQDSIFWSEIKRSYDVPPPRSASFHDFAKGDGKLARTVLQEASEVIAAIVLRRLKVPYEASSYHYNLPDDNYLFRVRNEFCLLSNQ